MVVSKQKMALQPIAFIYQSVFSKYGTHNNTKQLETIKLPMAEK
jgi:hypothetical protein